MHCGSAPFTTDLANVENCFSFSLHCALVSSHTTFPYVAILMCVIVLPFTLSHQFYTAPDVINDFFFSYASFEARLAIISLLFGSVGPDVFLLNVSG